MKVDPRFLKAQGPEIFTGNELLIKGALEADGGTHLIGGYPGSPIAGYFDTLAMLKDLLLEKGIRSVINNNEALSAAMLNGSQMVACRAMIAMKSVGVHVAADALALGNLSGAHPQGGAIVVYGDDPWSDSTQVPSDSRYISKHLFIPTIEPSDPQEIKDFVNLGYKLSSGAELYTGYVLTTNLADGGGSVQCSANQYPVFNTNQQLTLDTSLIDFDKRVLLPPRTWWQEDKLPSRLEKAVSISRKIGLNRILYPSNKRKCLGFVTSGLAHSYLVQALWELGLLGEYPILKYGMSYPIDAELLRLLGEQCERIVVVEERRGFIEEQVNEVVLKDRQLGRSSGNVDVWGKVFPKGLKGLPATRGLHPSIIISRLVPLLKHIHRYETKVPMPVDLDALNRELETIDATQRAQIDPLPLRTPTFCPGCPHRNSSSVCMDIKKRFMDAAYMRTRHGSGPVDLVFHGDTGCYTMLMFPPTSDLMHNYSGMGLGAGTGSGIDPFITNKQVVFMGDSTFFHSGQLGISQAIKLGQDITFIILDNRTTAMTGHQPTPGVEYDIMGRATPVQDIEEIVRGIVGKHSAPVLRVDPSLSKEYAELLEDTFLAPGVKVIIADRECGITRMRRQRREERSLFRQKGFLPTSEHMNINHEICRFCLTCIEQTGCPGLRHVETDYGRKMDTDISWCVNDGACEKPGVCSAFQKVTIRRRKPARTRLPELGLDDIPEPVKRPMKDDIWRCALVGVGGMGIGVATQIVVRAGHKEGYPLVFLDKKGLAIRNGSVVSQIVYNIGKHPLTAVIPFGKADLLIGVDLLEAARALDPRGRTRIASKERTAAVVNTDKVSTILDLLGKADFDVAELERIVRDNTRGDDFLARNISRICEKYLGSKLYANIMMLGFAFQKGLIPVSMHSMAWAIKDTIHTEFRKNLYAFNMGRKLVVQPDLFQGPPRRTDWRDLLEEKCRATIRRYGDQKLADDLRLLCASAAGDLAELGDDLKRDVVVRAYDCMRWGGLDYARKYTQAVLGVYRRDKADYAFAATRAVIYNLATAMLIKDAVFISELATSPEKFAHDREKYNVNPANGDSISYRSLVHARMKVGRFNLKLNFTAYNWMFQAVKRMKFLRNILPTHADQKRYLAAYMQQVADFGYKNADEYRRALGTLGGSQCMFCANPRCAEEGCPLESYVPQWVQLAYQQRWRDACDMLHLRNNFPEFTSRICPAFCESNCKQGIDNFPVQTRQIEADIVDRGFTEGWIVPQPPTTKTGRKVAIVGSGPAGLAAAQQLARAGHDVTVLEKDPTAGGLLRFGIPQFRLDKALIDRRLAQLQAEGVTFRCGTDVAKDGAAKALTEQFDAVLLAVGAAQPRDLKAPGRELAGIHYAMDYLRSAADANGSEAKISARGKVVVVIGGGLTGSDCMETALLQGAKEVHQFEIMPKSPQPFAHDPLATTDLAPVYRRWCVCAREFVGDGSLKGIQAVEVRWLATAGGNVMQEVEGSLFTTTADMAVLAMGFEPSVEAALAAALGLAVDDKGRPQVSEFATSVPGVFAAGDLVSGPSYVATAIASGRTAAGKIDAYLRAKA